MIERDKNLESLDTDGDSVDTGEGWGFFAIIILVIILVASVFFFIVHKCGQELEPLRKGVQGIDGPDHEDCTEKGYWHGDDESWQRFCFHDYLFDMGATEISYRSRSDLPIPIEDYSIGIVLLYNYKGYTVNAITTYTQGIGLASMLIFVDNDDNIAMMTMPNDQVDSIIMSYNNAFWLEEETFDQMEEVLKGIDSVESLDEIFRDLGTPYMRLNTENGNVRTYDEGGVLVNSDTVPL